MPLVLVTRVFLPTSTPTTPQARRNPHIPSHTTYTETGHPHQCRTAPPIRYLIATRGAIIRASTAALFSSHPASRVPYNPIGYPRK